MIRNIVAFFTAVVFVLFFSSACLCQNNTNTPAITSSMTDKSADKETVGGKAEEKKVKTDEEIKKEKDKAEEKKKEAEEEAKKETEEENPPAPEETLDGWGESTPGGSDLDRDGSVDIWKDDQGFIDR